MDAPETRYVAVGDAEVAYQVIGTGPVDLLWCYGLAGHIDLFWLDPLRLVPRFLEGLASFCRLILFDRRGVGASDALGTGRAPTWEELIEDMLAVLGVVDSKQAALMANLEAGPSAMLFAAMYPERVRALVLRNTMACNIYSEDYPIGASPEAVEGYRRTLATQWGTEDLARLANPGLAGSPEWIRYCAMVNRASATPRSATAQMSEFMDLDLRPVLPMIKAPTLVLHTTDNPMLPLDLGRYLAEHIEGARLIEVPGSDIGLVGDDKTLADIAEFLTGERPAVEVDRVLTTMLFTDIVGSTGRAASMGDSRWRALLDAHDRRVRELLERFRGREIDTTGDGFLASFDGPARAIRCARAVVESVRSLGIEVRAGLHTGECEVRGDDLGGIAVHIAARVAALAGPSEVLVSGTVKDLVVGSDISFSDRGEHRLKGVPGGWRLYSVTA
jgi:class 3 adenylate cyclase